MTTELASASGHIDPETIEQYFTESVRNQIEAVRTLAAAAATQDQHRREFEPQDRINADVVRSAAFNTH